MNNKNKDPFKIPKIIIQLKKKLISIDSSSFNNTLNTEES